MHGNNNQAVLKSAAAAFNDPNRRSAWIDIHDESVVAHGLLPQPLGLEGVKAFYADLWEAFPDLQIEIEDIVAEDDRVAWRLSATGTHRAEFRGVPATGLRVAFDAQYFFRFREGRIVERWTSFDRLGVMVQLGAIPSPV